MPACERLNAKRSSHSPRAGGDGARGLLTRPAHVRHREAGGGERNHTSGALPLPATGLQQGGDTASLSMCVLLFGYLTQNAQCHGSLLLVVG
jgi:hypothetical protein